MQSATTQTATPAQVEFDRLACAIQGYDVQREIARATANGPLPLRTLVDRTICKSSTKEDMHAAVAAYFGGR